MKTRKTNINLFKSGIFIYLFIYCKLTAHKDRSEDIENSYLRGISSVHNRSNSDDNSICACHVSIKILNESPLSLHDNDGLDSEQSLFCSQIVH